MVPIPKIKMRYFLQTFFVPIFVFTACHQLRSSELTSKSEGAPKTKDLQEIRIDPDSAITSDLTSAFLDSIRYLPLQTNEKSIFSQINQLEVTSKYYVIWDETTNCILFFKKDGSFVRKITNKDKALKVPFKKIDHFTINEPKGELMFNDAYSPYIYFYSLEGQLIRYERKPSFIGVAYANFGSFSAYFQCYDGIGTAAAKISSSNLVITEDGQQSNLYFPFDTLAVDYTDIYAVDKSFFNNQDGTIHFIKPYDYNVYTIDSKANIFNTFRILLPRVRTVPQDFTTNDTYKGKRMLYTNSNHQVIYAITDFYRVGHNITFRLLGHTYDQVFIYNLRTYKLRSMSSYISDKMSYFLPVSGGRIHGIDQEGNLISSIEAVTLFNAKLSLGGDPEWDDSLPAPLKSFYQVGNLQNPVLTILSMKQEI